jgi:hypothetical protein
VCLSSFLSCAACFHPLLQLPGLSRACCGTSGETTHLSQCGGLHSVGMHPHRAAISSKSSRPWLCPASSMVCVLPTNKPCPVLCAGLSWRRAAGLLCRKPRRLTGVGSTQLSEQAAKAAPCLQLSAWVGLGWLPSRVPVLVRQLSCFWKLRANRFNPFWVLSSRRQHAASDPTTCKYNCNRATSQCALPDCYQGAQSLCSQHHKPCSPSLKSHRPLSHTCWRWHRGH